MGKTSIEWTDFSVNPIRARNKKTGQVGHFCEKISPGCAHCYSSEWNENRFGTRLPFLPIHAGDVELFLDDGKLREVLSRRKPTRFFWCDMTDLFLDQHPDEWLDRCFATMALTPWHTHQVLTKRPERAFAYLTNVDRDAGIDEAAGTMSGAKLTKALAKAHAAIHHKWDEAHHKWDAASELIYSGLALPNVWLGVSAEDQRRAEKRIPLLINTPAALRFVSCEPLLGPLDIGAVLGTAYSVDGPPGPPMPGIDWVIVGGESGSGARACNVRWIRAIVEQCKAADCPVFVKQLGAHIVSRNDEVSDWLDECGISLDDVDTDGVHFQGDLVRVRLRDRKGGEPSEWPEDLRVREMPRAAGVAK